MREATFRKVERREVGADYQSVKILEKRAKTAL